GPIGSEEATAKFAQTLREQVANVRGAVDVHLAQVSKVPALRVAIDRTEAQQAGLTERDVAGDMLVSLASTVQTSPSYWIDKRGVQYVVSVQTPQYKIDSLDALRATPISTPNGKPQTLGNLARIERASSASNITHYNVARTWDV